MGNNRKKKQGITPNPAAGRSNASSGSFKLQDELAASSMSSESTTEKKEVTLNTASLSRNNQRNNGAATAISSGDNESHGSNSRSTFCAKETLLTNDADDMNKALLFSWKEMLTLCVILLCFAGCSIIVGVAAGVSISIHYYESPENVDHRRLSQQWDEGTTASTTQHVTRLDPTIAASLSTSQMPFANPSDAAPLRVIHTSTTGFRSVLHLVEESPSIGNDHTFHHTFSNTTYGSHSDDDGGGLYHHPSLDVTPPRWDTEVDNWLLHPPKLCSDSQTMGYDSWRTLRLALQDANRYSALRFEEWMHYFSVLAQRDGLASARSPEGYFTQASSSNLPFFQDDSLYYEEQFTFTICPGATLIADREPLLIDTESVTLECDGCTISGGTAHISFGPDAKNALIRGIRFQASSRSSVWMHQNGADAVFEDCTWVLPYRLRSKGARPSIISGLPAIAQVNSSSTVKFYRCYAEDPKLKYFFLPAWLFRTTL